MFTVIHCLSSSISKSVGTRLAFEAEIIVLRHQLLVLQRKNARHRVQIKSLDRILWVWLSRLRRDWRSALVIVKPETVIAWHRKGFRLYWTWKSRHDGGRPRVSGEICALIRKMSLANPCWVRREFMGNC
jgi:putative transposase